jgi:hypothetical protein
MSRLYLTNNFEFDIKHRLYKEQFCEPGTQDVPLFHKSFFVTNVLISDQFKIKMQFVQKHPDLIFYYVN